MAWSSRRAPRKSWWRSPSAAAATSSCASPPASKTPRHGPLARGGKLEDGVAHFAVEQPTDIASLLDAASRDGLEVIDVTLRRPNLESVFLQLTGRESTPMIAAIVLNGFRALRRDRGALILSFILPIAFFSIFGMIFGGMGSDSTPRVSVLVVDEDHSAVSERLVRGSACRSHRSLARTHPETKKGEPVPPDYTAATAETAVKQGDAPAALIIPKGFGANPSRLRPGSGSQGHPHSPRQLRSGCRRRWSPECCKRS